MDTLLVENGLVQNQTLEGVPLRRRIVSSQGRNANVRSRIPLRDPIGITLHNTGNPAPTADANAHATWLQRVEAEDQLWVGAHFFVDATNIVQTLPINEVSWHAGDGQGNGNRRTLSIEICETPPYAQGEANAVRLAAALLKRYPKAKLYTHQDWSGKYCPRLILDRNGWPGFVAAVQAKLKEKDVPAVVPETVLDNTPDPWAREAMAWAYQEKLMVGDTEGNLHLHRSVSRQELAAILQRFAKVVQNGK